MANVYTTTYLLTALKRRGMLATSGQTFTTDDYLALADEELATSVMPWLLDLHEEYCIDSVDVTVSANTASYDISSRVSGANPRSVSFQPDGTNGFVFLERIEPSRVQNYATTTGSVVGCCLEDESVVLVPTPSVGGTLRLKYLRRPGRLVAVDETAEITAINTGTKVLTLSATIPDSFSASVTYDIVKATPNFKTRGRDLAVTVASGTSMTFTAALPDGLAAGDFVALAGESPVPQIPAEAHPYLAHLVALRAVEALGDMKGVEMATASCDRMKRELTKLLSPRVQGSPRVIINYNGPGWNRWSRWNPRGR